MPTSFSSYLSIFLFSGLIFLNTAFRPSAPIELSDDCKESLKQIREMNWYYGQRLYFEKGKINSLNSSEGLCSFKRGDDNFVLIEFSEEEGKLVYRRLENNREYTLYSSKK